MTHRDDRIFYIRNMASWRLRRASDWWSSLSTLTAYYCTIIEKNPTLSCQHNDTNRKQHASFSNKFHLYQSTAALFKGDFDLFSWEPCLKMRALAFFTFSAHLRLPFRLNVSLLGIFLCHWCPCSVLSSNLVSTEQALQQRTQRAAWWLQIGGWK